MMWNIYVSHTYYNSVLLKENVLRATLNKELEYGVTLG